MKDDCRPEIEVALPILKRKLEELLGGYGPRSRGNYADSLKHIADFFDLAGFPSVVIRELLILTNALDELDRGNVAPFLEKSEVRPATTDSGETWLLRARVAIALQILMDSHIARRPAANRLASTFPELSPLLSPSSGKGGRRVTAGAFAGVIEKWHDRLVTGIIDHPLANVAWSKRNELIDQERNHCISVTGRSPTATELADFIVARVVGLATKQSTVNKIKDARHIHLRRRSRK